MLSKPIALSVLLCMLTTMTGCFGYRRITHEVIEDRELTQDEFKVLFHEDRLYTDCYRYHGNAGGLAYVEWDEAVDDSRFQNDPINVRVHHRLRRYRVPTDLVRFSPERAFEGYDTLGLRIVPARHGDEGSAIYELLENGLP
ncbi:MAG: hypothetical protein KTR15_06490 [Phycisphaeraceae bacterium]|nr:hypothetical protein [Phycisphaeraceae bacterium]